MDVEEPEGEMDVERPEAEMAVEGPKGETAVERPKAITLASKSPTALPEGIWVNSSTTDMHVSTLVREC